MTNPMLRAGSRRALAAAALLFAPAALQAQALPPAEELMARYTAAVGGEAAWSKVQGMHSSGSYSVPAMGMSAEFNVWSGRPDRMLLVVNIPGMGEMRQGYDGTTAWAVDPMQGARVLAGDELKATQDQAGFESSIRLIKNFQAAETVEKTTVGGQECYKVKLTWKSGRETFDCYSTADGLMIAQMATQESPMGAIEAVTTLSDYKQFGDIRIPTRNHVAMMGMEQVLTITAVEFGPVPEDRFALPPEIKALVK